MPMWKKVVLLIGAARAFAPGALPRVSPRLRAHNFHGSGDNSGGKYRMAGLWRLDRLPADDGSRARAVVPIQTSWSGNRWASPARAMTPRGTSVFVTLAPGGEFSTAPETPERERVRGTWSCDGAELTMAAFGRARNVVEEYTGEYSPENGVNGTMTYGYSDPEYFGTFALARVLASLEPVTENVEVPRTRPRVEAAAVVGSWDLEVVSDASAAIYGVRLYGNLTWETTGEMSGAKLAGKWNVADGEQGLDGVDVTSGIRGSGSRLWLWLRRFNSATTGVSLNHDRLYVGTISAPASSTDDDDAPPRVRAIAGGVAVGWATEVAWIGTFRMRPTPPETPAPELCP